MKRTADQAFQPSNAALIDPKAYFAQLMQGGAGMAPPGSVPSAASTSKKLAVATPVEEKFQDNKEMMVQLQEASAVKVAAIVKDKGAHFTTTVALEALNTLANKSSWHLRMELVKQAPVRKLLERVKDLIKAPPASLTMDVLMKAAINVMGFGDEVRGDCSVFIGPTARKIGATRNDDLKLEPCAKVLHALAKADAINTPENKKLVSKIVGEIVKDKGLRMKELSHKTLVEFLWTVARANRHIKEGDHPTIHSEANDELFFDLAAKRFIKEVDTVDVWELANLAHTHAEIGIRNEELFKAICPRIVAKKKDLKEEMMAKVIKAYCRFMIPLREEQQGFRTMAVVAKGDFIRPSEKPKRQGKRVFEQPLPLYPATQVHSRG